MKKELERQEKRKAALEKEKNRFYQMCSFEREAFENGYRLIAGIDEVGRGPLAGPVVAAAVILPENIFISGLNDSKKLSPGKREELYSIIMEKALAFGLGMTDEKVIDEINILNATKKAMVAAVQAMKSSPDLLLIDAVKLDKLEIHQKAIIKGDALSISIAAASIIAKVTRDRMMDEQDCLYPQYGFSRNKGYGTSEHIEAINKFGICPIHRLSFTKNFAG